MANNAASAASIDMPANTKGTKDTKGTKGTKARKAPTAAKAPATLKAQDAIALLRADHKHVNELFDKYEKTRSAVKKKQIVADICTELTVHTQIEEEIFYPAVKAALKDRELVPEATVEHASVKDLIAQVKNAEPEGEEFDARIKVMSEYVKHHVKEEQNEMFPKAKATKLDMRELGAQMSARKQELMASSEQLH